MSPERERPPALEPAVVKSSLAAAESDLIVSPALVKAVRTLVLVHGAENVVTAVSIIVGRGDVR